MWLSVSRPLGWIDCDRSGYEGGNARRIEETMRANPLRTHNYSREPLYRHGSRRTRECETSIMNGDTPLTSTDEVATRPHRTLWTRAGFAIFLSIALGGCARSGAPNPEARHLTSETSSGASGQSLTSVEAAPRGSPSRAPASVASALSAGPCDTQCLIDQLTGSLKRSKVAFNAPTSLQVGQLPTAVSLVLSVNESYDILRQEISGQGPTKTASVRSGPEMYASLIGSQGLRVTPTTQSIMARPSHGRARWDWQVSGIHPGAQFLNLSLFAVVDTAPNAPQILIRTFSRRLSVTVTARYEIRRFFKRNWQWLWGVMVVPLAAWLWHRLRSKRSPVN